MTQTASTASQRGGETIEQTILRALEQYFVDLDGARPHRLHGMVIGAAERPLLKFALDRCQGNQSAAAELLGINRNTLRKKMLEHGLAEAPVVPAPAAAVRKRSGARGPARTAARGKTSAGRSPRGAR
jgi:Fis family transcriptional regulator